MCIRAHDDQTLELTFSCFYSVLSNPPFFKMWLLELVIQHQQTRLPPPSSSSSSFLLLCRPSSASFRLPHAKLTKTRRFVVTGYYTVMKSVSILWNICSIPANKDHQNPTPRTFRNDAELEWCSRGRGAVRTAVSTCTLTSTSEWFNQAYLTFK